ncbi:glycosyltransferase family 2 protein [Parabacteroides sp.]
MKVSIITSCFNRENTIRDSIESVLSQDYSDIEYIVIDGASTDKSVDIINEYRESIASFISEPDSGMYEGINKGIQLATGDIIGLLHSDDVLYAQNTISQIIKRFKETDADIIYGDGLFVDHDNLNKVIRRWISGQYNKNKIKMGWLPLHPTVYIKRDCFNQIGYYDESFKIAADSDFLIRSFYKNNFKISYLNEFFVRMRMGGVSTSITKTIIKWKEDIRMYRNNGFNPYFSLPLKILSKIPQFINAKLK